MWERTRQFALQAFDVLKSDFPVNFWFVDNKTSTEVTDEFQFFMMVDDKIPNDNKMREKMTLSIRVES